MYVEMLRGRDGLPGKNGESGPCGPPGERGSPGVPRGGATYTRWGKKDCPEVPGTEKVYHGITVGSDSDHDGGGANYLCMPEVPDYDLSYISGTGSSVGKLYGTEYEKPLRHDMDHYNIPCAVCHVHTRAAVIMIPAKATCPNNWYREYYGYLMSEDYGHKRSTFECVDKDMDYLPGNSEHTDNCHFHHVEAMCNVGIPCPPYNNYKELNCVVCTK